MKTKLLTILALTLALMPALSWSAAPVKVGKGESASIQIFPMGFLPWDLAFDGANIWTNDFFGNTVAKVRASDGVIIARYYAGIAPRCLAYDGASTWVGNESGEITKLRASDGMIETTVDLGTSALGHILFDGQNIWVSAWGGGSTVFKLQPSDGTILGSYLVGRNPYGLAFDGQNIWVANSVDNTVSKLRASDGRVLFTVPAGPAPWGMCYDGRSIWLSNSYSHTMTHLRLSDGAILATVPVGAAPPGARL